VEKHIEIADILNSATCITLEFQSRQYQGEIIDLTIKKYITFRVNDADDELACISIDHDAMYLRVMMAQGGFNIYQTRLMEKKIPLLQLKFPEEECRALAREYSRYPVNMDTPITVLNRKGRGVTGEGTIYNISECGVYLNTDLKLETGDRIGFCLGFHDSGDENSLELTGEVKRTILPTPTPPPRGGGSYGVRFTGINIRTLRKVQTFIKRR